MDEPNTEKHISLEWTSIPGRSWPGASLYKSLKLGWHWRRLRWAVVAASEAAQGHEANGLPLGPRESQTRLWPSSILLAPAGHETDATTTARPS